MAEVKIRGLVKRFETDGEPVEVLTGVDLELSRGDAVVITGPSGAGKSTLLHLIGGLDQPSAGTIEIGGQAFQAPNLPFLEEPTTSEPLTPTPTGPRPSSPSATPEPASPAPLEPEPEQRIQDILKDLGG